MIGLVLATYAHWPERLMTSVESTGLNVAWFVHHHGSQETFANRVSELASKPNVVVHMHKQNRGLARSWNEGVHEGYRKGCRLMLLVNDDLHFTDDGFRRFIGFADSKKDFGLLFLNGLEIGGSPFAGSVKNQGFGCCVMTQYALERVGYLDQNFVPAYYEDYDYARRCYLSDTPIIDCPDVLVEHERSRTTRENPEILARNAEVMRANEAYYVRKWGPPDNPIYTVPFNDPECGLRISWEQRDRPYPGHDLE